MTDYIALRINVKPCSGDITDLLAAYLADIGYESFVPDDNGLTAYIKADDFDESGVRNMLDDFPYDVETTLIPAYVKGENWNEEWEKHYFNPIVIDDKVVVHSSFHKDVPKADIDIVIDPKMAFGTGHHATTSMMMRLILGLDIKDRSVLDMGTGTGILAILAKMRGASEVLGLDIDPDAIINAAENAELNNVKADFMSGDACTLHLYGKYDYVFANINRNVLLADMPLYAAHLNDTGSLLLSGFYEDDVEAIVEAGAKCGLKLSRSMADNRWAAVELAKA